MKLPHMYQALFVPRFSFGSVSGLDRVLVPTGGSNTARQQVVAAWATGTGRPVVEDIYQSVDRGESAYEATLQDLARTRHGALAQTMARSLFYPTDSGEFGAAAWPIRDALAAAAIMLVGAGIVFGATHVKFPPRRKLRAKLQPA